MMRRIHVWFVSALCLIGLALQCYLLTLVEKASLLDFMGQESHFAALLLLLTLTLGQQNASGLSCKTQVLQAGVYLIRYLLLPRQNAKNASQNDATESLELLLHLLHVLVPLLAVYAMRCGPAEHSYNAVQDGETVSYTLLLVTVSLLALVDAPQHAAGAFFVQFQHWLTVASLVPQMLLLHRHPDDYHPPLLKGYLALLGLSQLFFLLDWLCFHRPHQALFLEGLARVSGVLVFGAFFARLVSHSACFNSTTSTMQLLRHASSDLVEVPDMREPLVVEMV